MAKCPQESMFPEGALHQAMLAFYLPPRIDENFLPRIVSLGRGIIPIQGVHFAETAPSWNWQNVSIESLYPGGIFAGRPPRISEMPTPESCCPGRRYFAEMHPLESVNSSPLELLCPRCVSTKSRWYFTEMHFCRICRCLLPGHSCILGVFCWF